MHHGRGMRGLGRTQRLGPREAKGWMQLIGGARCVSGIGASFLSVSSYYSMGEILLSCAPR